MRTDDAAHTGAPACTVRLEPDRHADLHADLDHWRANVGAPVAIDSAKDAPPRLSGLDVVCWNVAIGRGRLDALLERLRTGAFADGRGAFVAAGVDETRPLVLLLQEVYRAGESVPATAGSRHHGGLHPGTATRADIVAFARSHSLSLRYSPSMRNGTHASDRGNAVLSTVRLDHARAFLLPYARQRRVVVAARIAGHDELNLVSAHLDTHGGARTPTGRRLRGGRITQAAALGAALGRLPGTVILGADLNTFLGVSDPAMRALVSAGLHPARRVGTWRHTFHGPLRLLLDHVLYRTHVGSSIHAEVVRLDEAPGDRSRGVFGSDHHPLLARFEFGAT